MFEYMFLFFGYPGLSGRRNFFAVVSLGEEHSSSELLMRWMSKEKVTHFTLAVPWPSAMCVSTRLLSVTFSLWE